MEPVRLQKYLAEMGAASRRTAEKMMLDGRVSVNGRIANELGTKITPGVDKVMVDKKEIAGHEPRVIYAFNKPRGVASTVFDPFAAKKVTDFFPDDVRVYPVGRLDKESEGLMLVTNDGALAHELMHPRHEHEKEYEVTLVGQGKPMADFERPYQLLVGRTRPMKLVSAKKLPKERYVVRLVLREGKKRQIREVARRMGYRVLSLVRVRIGRLLLGDLPMGKWKIVRREDII